MSVISKVASYGLRGLKAYPKLIFGTNSDLVGEAIKKAVKGTSGSVFTKAKAATKAGFKVLESGSTGKAFFKEVGKEIAGLPRSLARGTKAGYLKAIHAGKNGIIGGIKGFGGKVLKKMPLIGTLVTIGLELPNIFRAGKEQGVGQALKETGKAAARLGGAALGAAIGSAICPGLGSVVGWIAGEFLTGLVVGKTYTEKKDDAIENLKEMGLTDEDIEAAKEQGVNPIELEKTLIEELKEENSGEKVKGKKAKSTDEESKDTESQGTDKKAKPKTPVQDPYGFGRLLNSLNGYSYYMPQQMGTYTPFFPQTYADPLATNPQFNMGANPFTQYMNIPSFYYS